MARPFLGPNYGNTDRRTPAQLLGGTPEASSQAAIGTQVLAIPGLQPANMATETFSPAGRAVMPSGPAQVPTPPQLPMAQAPVLSPLPRPLAPPNPVVMDSVNAPPVYAPYVDNIGALAQSLAGFSTFFDKLNNYAQDQDKKADQRAQGEGAALAQEASQLGPFTSLQELQKRLEKGVAEGAAGYEDMLRRFKAADPRALRYALINMQTAYLDGSAATLKERLSQTKKLLDGRSLESVPADDPEFQRTMTALMFPQGTAGIMPEVFKSRQQQIQATYGSALADQERRYGGYKTQKAKQSWNAVVDSSAEQLVSGNVPPEQIAATLSQGLNGLFLNSGLTTEEYQKEKKDVAKQLVGATLLATGGNWGRTKVALGRLPEVLAQVAAGPNGELLLDQIGGKAAFLEIVQEAQEAAVKQQNLQDSVEQRDSNEQADIDIQQAFTPEVLGSPAAIDQTEEILLARGRQLYANSPEQALAYEERVKKHASGIRAGYVQPVQEKSEVALWAEMAQSPGVDFTQRIMDLQQSGQLSYQAAKGFLQAQASRNREDNKANYQVLRGLQEDLKKRLEAQYARGSSEGGSALTPNEARQLWESMGQLYRKGDELIRKAPGQDMTNELGNLYSNSLQLSLPQQKPQPPANATPESISKGLAPGARGNREQNNQLRRQAETQPLYSKDRMGQQLDQILSGKPLDDATRNIIRRTGMKPSEFFTKQMQLHGIEVDGDARKRLQELDGSDLVSEAPQAKPNPYLAMAARLQSQITNGLLNTLAPPAAAAERGSFPFMGSGERPASVVYERPSGQPGVDYWFPSKQFPAVLPGRVKDIGREPGYGNYVVVESTDPRNGRKVDVLYGHLPDGGTFVRQGQAVIPGQVIGRQGGTGNVQSADGTIASVDFFAPRPAGSKDMTPYADFDGLRRYVTSQLQSGQTLGSVASRTTTATVTTKRGGGMTGIATYYTGSGGSDGVAGGMTANNRDRFDPNAMTVAVQRSLRGKYLDKWLLVEDLDSGKTVRVYANDVGSMGGTDSSINRNDPRIVDLSPAAFKQLYGSLDRGTGRIRVRIDPNQRGQSPSRVRASAQSNEELGSQFIAQLEAESGYEDTAGPAVQRKPWAGVAGQFSEKGPLQNGLDAINKAGASIPGFLQGKSNDLELVRQFYVKNPAVANQYDLPVNLFLRYISGVGAKGLQVSQAQGQKVVGQIEGAKRVLPEVMAWVEQNMKPDYAAMYRRNVAKGMIPVAGWAGGRSPEIDNSLGRFWATPQKDGSYLITEDFNFGYAPKSQSGNDKRASAVARTPLLSIDPQAYAVSLVARGFGKPFRYTLRVWPDGRVQVVTR